MRLWLTGSQGHVWLTDNPKNSLWVCPAERGFSTQGGTSWRLPGYTKRLESIASSSKRKTSVLISLPPGAQLEFSGEEKDGKHKDEMQGFACTQMPDKTDP